MKNTWLTLTTLILLTILMTGSTERGDPFFNEDGRLVRDASTGWEWNEDLQGWQKQQAAGQPPPQGDVSCEGGWRGAANSGHRTSPGAIYGEAKTHGSSLSNDFIVCYHTFTITYGVEQWHLEDGDIVFKILVELSTRLENILSGNRVGTLEITVETNQTSSTHKVYDRMSVDNQWHRYNHLFDYGPQGINVGQTIDLTIIVISENHSPLATSSGTIRHSVDDYEITLLGEVTEVKVMSDVVMEFAWVFWALFAVAVYFVPKGIPRILVTVVGFSVIGLPIEGTQRTILVGLQIALTVWVIYKNLFERRL